MIEKYIKDLLFEYECVVLPGFGGFITQYVSADIHPITHKMNPPSVKVAFNEQLKNNDGLLIDAVASGESISREAAAVQVKEYVGKINESLAARRFFELKDVGRFFYNQENLLEFEPETTVNYLEESFGLPELIFKPIDRTINTMNQSQKPVKPVVSRKTAPDKASDEPVKKINPALIILPIILLVLGGATAFFYYNQDNKDLAGINPFVLFGSKEAVVAETTAEPVKDTLASVDPATEITEQPKRYYIVVGSFQDKINAMKLREKLEFKKVNATIVDPAADGENFRVSVAEFDDKEVAKAELEKFQSKYGKSTWILTY